MLENSVAASADLYAIDSFFQGDFWTSDFCRSKCSLDGSLASVSSVKEASNWSRASSIVPVDVEPMILSTSSVGLLAQWMKEATFDLNEIAHVSKRQRGGMGDFCAAVANRDSDALVVLESIAIVNRLLKPEASENGAGQVFRLKAMNRLRVAVVAHLANKAGVRLREKQMAKVFIGAPSRSDSLAAKIRRVRMNAKSVFLLRRVQAMFSLAHAPKRSGLSEISQRFSRMVAQAVMAERKIHSPIALAADRRVLLARLTSGRLQTPGSFKSLIASLRSTLYSVRDVPCVPPSVLSVSSSRVRSHSLPLFSMTENLSAVEGPGAGDTLAVIHGPSTPLPELRMETPVSSGGAEVTVHEKIDDVARTVSLPLTLAIPTAVGEQTEIHSDFGRPLESLSSISEDEGFVSPRRTRSFDLPLSMATQTESSLSLHMLVPEVHIKNEPVIRHSMGTQTENEGVLCYLEHAVCGFPDRAPAARGVQRHVRFDVPDEDIAMLPDTSTGLADLPAFPKTDDLISPGLVLAWARGTTATETQAADSSLAWAVKETRGSDGMSPLQEDGLPSILEESETDTEEESEDSSRAALEEETFPTTPTLEELDAMSDSELDTPRGSPFVQRSSGPFLSPRTPSPSSDSESLFFNSFLTEPGSLWAQAPRSPAKSETVQSVTSRLRAGITYYRGGVRYSAQEWEELTALENSAVAPVGSMRETKVARRENGELRRLARLELYKQELPNWATSTPKRALPK